MAPVKALKVARIKINFVLFEKKRKFRSIIGAIFCTVIKIQQVVQGAAFMTFGNQKWQGAAPSFIISEIIIKVDINGKMFKKIIDIRKITDAVACAKKYFKAASFSK